MSENNYSIVATIMKRDGLSLHEAIDLVNDAREQVAQGANPEEVTHDEFGLEPDYAWDLMR
jgi:hypothetical protein